MRFLGTTIDTSSIYKTYSSIALHLHFITTILKKKHPNTENEYVKMNFHNYEEYCSINDMEAIIKFIFKQFEQISKLDAKHKILILLDSLARK